MLVEFNGITYNEEKKLNVMYFSTKQVSTFSGYVTRMYT